MWLLGRSSHTGALPASVAPAVLTSQGRLYPKLWAKTKDPWKDMDSAMGQQI